MLVGAHHLPVQRACRVVRLSRAASDRPPVPASRREAAVIAARTDGGGGALPAVGLLEGRRPLPRRRTPLEPHAGASRVRRAARASATPRTTRRVPRRVRQPLTAPPVLNRTWALDVMSEPLDDARRVRLLTVIDEGNREGLEVAMGLSLPSRRVLRVLDEP